MLFIEPHAGVTPVTQFIESAHRTLDINAYLVTDRRVLAAIAATVRRGVRVRILIDRKPYGGRPRGEVGHLKATGAIVRFAPPRFTGKYRFDHAKYMVSGESVEMGSANLTWSAYTKNREYLWTAQQPAVAHALHTVFHADWRQQAAGPGPRRVLVLSPGATPALLRVIGQPGSVCIESEEMGKDRPILAALRRKGASAQVVLPSRLNRYDRKIAGTLAQAGVRVRYLTTPYLHAKLIAGTTAAFIGSENFTWTSLNRNREVGILLGQPDAGHLSNQCERDWRAASP